jgi:regulatory factor X
MQQQYFALSPMAGQESFSAIDVRPAHHIMAHTPTTSSMLAALQHDAFPSGSLDPTSSGFNSDAYGPLSYMDTSPFLLSINPGFPSPTLLARRILLTSALLPLKT